MQEVDTTRECVLCVCWCVCVGSVQCVLLSCEGWEAAERERKKRGERKKDSPAGVINISDHTLSRIKANYVSECSTDEAAYPA